MNVFEPFKKELMIILLSIYSELCAMWSYLKACAEEKLDQHSELLDREHQKMLSQKKKACWIHPQES